MRCFDIRTGIVAVLVAFGAACANPAHADELSFDRIAPEGALATAHINVAALRRSPNFEFLEQLALRVDSETSAFSLSRFGFDIATLSAIDVIVPPLEELTLQNTGRRAPVVLVATLSDAIQPDRLIDYLQTSHGFVDRGRELLVHDDLAVHIASNHTIVFGPPATLVWWQEALAASDGESMAQRLAASLGEQHIAVGIDLKQVPASVHGVASLTLQTLLQSDVGAIGLTLGDMIGIEGALQYSAASDAARSADVLKGLVGQGEALLASANATATAKLNDPHSSTEDGLGSLAALALIRQAQAYLADVELQQQTTQVRAGVRIDNELSTTVMMCLGAVRAIGANAEQEFQAVADQLNAP